MRGIAALVGCALVAAQGATGFVAPLSARAPVQQQQRRWASRAVLRPAQPAAAAAAAAAAATRLRMVATDFPKFTVSLMDDTRVSFHMNEENVRKLAAEVCFLRCCCCCCRNASAVWPGRGRRDAAVGRSSMPCFIA